MKQAIVKTSKFLSLVLRHHPERIGLTLDPNGWVDVDVLLEAAQRSGKRIDRELLDRVVRENDKQRFTMSDDGRRIRAAQGHSVDVDLELSAIEPPELLYHGTVARFWASIKQHGLRPGSRQYVHLSRDIDTATRVGQRRGKPVILAVRAGEMDRQGMRFYCSANGVWLTHHVPASLLRKLPERDC